MPIIDRFEGDRALLELEEGGHIWAPRAALPPEAQEGDCLRSAKGGYALDEAATQARRAQLSALRRRLIERSRTPRA